MNTNLLAMMALSYTRPELPGWGKLLRGLGVFDDARWVGAPTRRLRGKLDGYEHLLDLRDWSDRQFFFLGRYYELSPQLLLNVLLCSGDTFIDIGANVGMYTLLAARRVGPQGRVEAFEPNAQACQRLTNALHCNRLAHIRLHPIGLSDEPGRLTLSVPSLHSGFATFAPVSPGQHMGEDWAQHEVAVRRGDDVLLDRLPDRPLLIKIDVEGFERRVIDGLRGTMQQCRPAVIVEVVPKHLAQANSSAEEIFERMEGLGYRSFEMGTRRVRLRRRLWIKPVKRDQCYGRSGAWNVVWLLPQSVHEQRLRAAIQRGDVREG